MRRSWRRILTCVLGLCLAGLACKARGEQPWPPALPGAERGTVSTSSARLLEVPASVAEARTGAGAAPFTVASTPPTVELAYHDQLGPGAVQRRLWSSWGDICLADDGRVYGGIGDHGDDVGGDARCFVYCWDPARRELRQVVDMNQVVPASDGQPAWSKIHARIDQAADGGIYFSCTLNDGNRARLPQYQWNERLPGGQLYRYDPQSGRTERFADLPARRCTATSILDRQRNLWWCNLEAGDGNALWALDLNSRQAVFQAPDGSLGFNRNFALAADGSIIFNRPDALWRCDGETRRLSATKSSLENSPGMRCSTRQSADGWIYGITHQSHQLFRYSPARDQLEPLGPNWLAGSYTAVCELSPDERFVYYLPGAHGGAFRDGTPVVQYELATGRRKVLAFLAAAIEQQFGYVPAGTYGMKISRDGGTLYVNFNGHAADPLRPEKMRPNGFGLCAFAAIHIPPSER